MGIITKSDGRCLMVFGGYSTKSPLPFSLLFAIICSKNTQHKET